jgi:hypothetical protein
MNRRLSASVRRFLGDKDALPLADLFEQARQIRLGLVCSDSFHAAPPENWFRTNVRRFPARKRSGGLIQPSAVKSIGISLNRGSLLKALMRWKESVECQFSPSSRNPKKSTKKKRPPYKGNVPNKS